MDIPIFDTRRGLRLTPLAAALITLVGTLALAANEPSVPPTSGTPSGSDRVLPPNVAISVNVVTRLFPEVTQEAATGQNETAVGNPKATRSVIYADNHSSKKVTISVDQQVRVTRRRLMMRLFRGAGRFRGSSQFPRRTSARTPLSEL